MSTRIDIKNIGIYAPYCLIHNKLYRNRYGTTKWYCKDCQVTIDLSVKVMSK